jgi:hypothetical protein
MTASPLRPVFSEPRQIGIRFFTREPASCAIPVEPLGDRVSLGISLICGRSDGAPHDFRLGNPPAPRKPLQPFDSGLIESEACPV